MNLVRLLLFKSEDEQSLLILSPLCFISISVNETTTSIRPTNHHPENKSRSVTAACANSPQRPALHPPTSPSSGFSQPSKGLAKSAHRDDHIHDDMDDDKLKELCNTILHEFYDAKNFEVSHPLYRNALS